MVFAPEAQILILNCCIIAVAYIGIFPSLVEKTLQRIMSIDLILSAIALTVAGALFWGADVSFSLLFFDTNWAVFTIVPMMLIEVGPFLLFARKNGIDLFDDDQT